MRFSYQALMLPDPDRSRATSGDPELSHQIRSERIRMLFAPTLPTAVVSAAFAVGLSLLVAAQIGQDKAAGWAVLCVVCSLIRVLHLSCYVGSSNRASAYWLNSLTILCALHGAIWGLIGVVMPMDDLITTSVIVASLIGACAVCTFSLQAHIRPNLAVNLPMVLPAIVMLFTRQDAYGLFGGFGLMALLALMMHESRRVARRTNELLWLRFTTDRIARERAEALKLAQRHSAVKDQFLANMSHEMRTPLHGILGLARLVNSRLPARPGVLNDARHQVALIERTGEHLLGIVNDVLDLSRIEAGKLQIAAMPFDLNSVMADALALLSITATEKGLKLNADVQLPKHCWVKGDAPRMHQLLHNLVGNAIKFTDAGKVDVHVSRDADKVIFRIEDTGMGIPPAHLSLIFDAFHQVDGTFGRKHKGTGLGLTISRDIARAMGGDIQCVHSGPQGSTFTLTVPMPAVPFEEVAVAVAVDLALPLDDEAPPSTPPASPDTFHILLAEDNPVNALVAEASLAKLGMTFKHVEDGMQALAELQREDHPYDLVLMDCQMPTLDGIEATRRLRIWERNQGRPPIAVIALTANAMSSDRERCLAAGMNEHLPKPFHQKDLQAVLNRHLRQVLSTHEP